MVEFSSIEYSSIDTLNIDKQQFRLSEVNEIKYYFIAEIKETELMSKRLRKYTASFDYFDKSLIVLSVTSYIFIVYKNCKKIIKRIRKQEKNK